MNKSPVMDTLTREERSGYMSRVKSRDTGPEMRSVELFAGCGGLALGISRSGFVHEAVVEREKNAFNTLVENKRHQVAHVAEWPVHQDDVATFSFDGIATDLDLLAGGVPCQPFSCAGKSRGHEDERNMFPAMTRAVRMLRPKAVLVENVKGLTREAFAPYLAYVKAELRFPELERRTNEDWRDHHVRLNRHADSQRRVAGLEYDVHFHAVNAADYGVPQWRERVFIIAFRRDLAVEWTIPAATHSGESLLWDQYRTGEYWDRHGLKRREAAVMTSRFRQRLEDVRQLEMLVDKSLPWRTVRDALLGLPRLRAGEVAKDDPNHFLNPGARTYARHTGSPLDEPAKTVKAGIHGVPGGENTVALDDGTTRYFSVRECARIQTFPDVWRFEGTWSRAMGQIGNAVPVELAEVFARAIGVQLKRARRGARRAVGTPQSQQSCRLLR